MHFAELGRPFVIAHRGGAMQVPEHTMEGYRVAVGQGLPVIEQDVCTLADGGLGVMHDGTVDRMTTSSGNVADHTSVSWKQLDIDASAILGGGWPDGLRPPLFEEVLTEFGERVLLCVEAKSSDAMGPVIDALERRGVSPASVLLQSFALADCRLARSRGWDVIWLGSTDVVRAAVEGIGWIGPAADQVTSTVCTGAHALGIEVACHTVNRRHQRDVLVADGVDAIFSDDPVYIAGDAGQRASDLFARQVWLPGMLPDTTRGRFHADDGSWGLDVSGAPTSTLMGFLAPPDPAASSLSVDLRVDATCADERTSCGWVLLSTDDHPYRPPGPSVGADGYLFLLRADGELEVRRVDDGVATPLESAPRGDGADDGHLRAAPDHRHRLGPALRPRRRRTEPDRRRHLPPPRARRPPRWRLRRGALQERGVHMTDPWERPGHGPSDPEGYLIQQTPDGYRWTRRADGRTAGPFASRDDAVVAAEAAEADSAD